MSIDRAAFSDQEIWTAVTHCPSCDQLLAPDDVGCLACQTPSSPTERVGSPEAAAELPRIAQARDQQAVKHIAAVILAALAGFHLLSLLYLQYAERPDLNRAAAKGGEVKVASRAGRRAIESKTVKRYAKLFPGTIQRELAVVVALLPMIVLAFFWPRLAAAAGVAVGIIVNLIYFLSHPGQLGMLANLVMAVPIMTGFAYLLATISVVMIIKGVSTELDFHIY